MLPGQMDLFAAKAERDVKMGRLRSKNSEWVAKCIAQIEGLPAGWEGTGEDLRVRLTVEPPTHPNAWGIVVRVALSRKIIAPTCRYTNMKLKSSHARLTPIYRRTANGANPTPA